VKLIIAIIQDKDTGKLVMELSKNEFRSTKLASTGGFLGGGNTTLLIGVDEAKVPEVMEIIRRTCQSRKQITTPVIPVGMGGDSYIPIPTEVTIGGATLFVLDVENFEKI
jgi:uncharacterized protein YaaQ